MLKRPEGYGQEFGWRLSVLETLGDDAQSKRLDVRKGCCKWRSGQWGRCAGDLIPRPIVVGFVDNGHVACNNSQDFPGHAHSRGLEAKRDVTADPDFPGSAVVGLAFFVAFEAAGRPFESGRARQPSSGSTPYRLKARRRCKVPGGRQTGCLQEIPATAHASHDSLLHATQGT